MSYRYLQLENYTLVPKSKLERHLWISLVRLPETEYQPHVIVPEALWRPPLRDPNPLKLDLEKLVSGFGHEVMYLHLHFEEEEVDLLQEEVQREDC